VISTRKPPISSCQSRPFGKCCPIAAALFRASFLGFVQDRLFCLGEEVDLLGENLAAFAGLSFGISPLGVVDAPARLDLLAGDRFGKSMQPREWFFLPLNTLNELVGRISDGSITEFR
jgi:hypothetical protein